MQPLQNHCLWIIFIAFCKSFFLRTIVAIFHLPLLSRSIHSKVKFRCNLHSKKFLQSLSTYCIDLFWEYAAISYHFASTMKISHMVNAKIVENARGQHAFATAPTIMKLISGKPHCVCPSCHNINLLWALHCIHEERWFFCSFLGVGRMHRQTGVHTLQVCLAKPTACLSLHSFSHPCMTHL